MASLLSDATNMAVTTATTATKLANPYNLTMIATVVVTLFFLVWFLYVILWGPFKFWMVDNNVRPLAKARIHVNCEHEISLRDLDDPNNVFGSATFGSQEGTNKTTCHGEFNIQLPEKSVFDFKKTTIVANSERNYVHIFDIDKKTLSLKPLHVQRDDDEYQFLQVTGGFDILLTLTMGFDEDEDDD